MNRSKTFDATGIAPNGRLYAGDLNLIQDLAAAVSDFAQNLQAGSVAVGDATLSISKFGAGEIQVSAALRALGILRSAGGLITGAYTTTQRDAIAVGSRPATLVIYNTTNGRFEYNAGTDPTPNWQPIAAPQTGPKITTSTLAGGPPASPADGDIWNATGVDGAGVRWQFQYNAASGSAYKWEFIGGSAQQTFQDAADTTTSAAYVSLAHAHTMSLARAGDYSMEVEAIIFGVNHDANDQIGLYSYGLTYAGGSYGPNDADAAQNYTNSFQGGYQTSGFTISVIEGGSVSRKRRVTAVSANTTITCQGRTTNGGVVTFANRSLTVTPIRIA